MLYKLLSNERVVLSHPPLQAALPVGRKTERRWNVHVRAVFAPATDTAPLRDNLSTSLRTSSSLLTKGPSAPHVRVSPARAPVFTAHAQYPHRFFPRLPYQFPSICQYTTFPIETVRYVSFASFLISSVDVHLFSFISLLSKPIVVVIMPCPRDQTKQPCPDPSIRAKRVDISLFI